MTESNSLDKLKKNRSLLLTLEAIGWLHLTGKAKVDFLRNHGDHGNQESYEYQNWAESGNSPFSWNERLNWVKENFPLKEEETPESQSTWPENLTDFLAQHAERNFGLLGLLQASHAMASGIEKQSYAKGTVQYLGQKTKNMWLSSAFGYPERNLLRDLPELLTDHGWEDLLERIKKLLEELKGLGNSASQHTDNDLNNWRKWRDDAVGPDGWLRKAFTGTLAETRLPNNDVTLFDQSYVAAALFKSAAAGAILKGKNFIWKNNRLKQETRWRLLTVGIGSDHYEGRSVKIGDLIGAQQAIQSFFKEVCGFVEIDLAVGSLLYADEEVRVFSFPGEPVTDKKGNEGKATEDEQTREWENWLTERIDNLAREANFETPSYCSISESSRSLTGITKEIEKAKNTMAVPLHRKWEIADKKPSEGHTCPVCLVRGSGDGKNKQTTCKICKGRRDGRLNKWLNNKKIGNDTIWISELADSKDRLALVTMSLEIEPWLDGSRLDSLRTQAIPDWRQNYKSLENNKELENIDNLISQSEPFESLCNYIERKLDSFDSKDPVMKNLQSGYRYERGWESFYSKTVEDRSDSPGWKSLNKTMRARWLTHQLFCKLASPGRIYRFQRQSEKFFGELLTKFGEIASSSSNRWRTRRLVFKPEEISPDSWIDGQTYSGHFEDVPISLLYRKSTGDFLTVSNLTRLMEKKEIDDFKGVHLELGAEDGEHRKQIQEMYVKSVSDVSGGLKSYNPVIPLEISPVRFRVLLPLEAVSDCVDWTVDQWEKKLSRVWDRLPLRIGVVAFTRMTPFQAVIDTVRSVEANLTEKGRDMEVWHIKQSETRDGEVSLEMTTPDSQSFVKNIPVTLPDGRSDVFYPYFAVVDRQIRSKYDFQHPNGQTYRSVKELQDGDRVYVHPSYITTVFLDNAARRFEPIIIKRIEEWQDMLEIWKLIDKVVPSRTALRGAWEELDEKRCSWQETDGRWLEKGEEAWLDLARTVFHVRLKIGGPPLETLVKAAGSGLLEWSLVWHMNILKKGLSSLKNRQGEVYND